MSLPTLPCVNQNGALGGETIANIYIPESECDSYARVFHFHESYCSLTGVCEDSYLQPPIDFVCPMFHL